MVNKCKYCKEIMKEDGVHPEAKDYKKWTCSCDSKAKCIVCQKEFNMFTGRPGRRHNISKRKRGSITCSKQCSRIYMRINKYITNHINNKLRKNGK